MTNSTADVEVIVHDDVWGEPGGGFVINNSSNRGMFPKPKRCTNDEVLQFLIDNLLVGSSALLRDFSIDMSSAEVVYVDAEDGFPLYTLIWPNTDESKPADAK